MEESSVEFLNNVRLDVYRRLGAEAAIVLAYLGFVGRVKHKDARGFFVLDSVHAAKSLGVSRSRFIRGRDKLVSDGLIEYVEGANQNAKPRYRLPCGKLVENSPKNCGKPCGKLNSGVRI